MTIFDRRVGGGAVIWGGGDKGDHIHLLAHSAYSDISGIPWRKVLVPGLMIIITTMEGYFETHTNSEHRFSVWEEYIMGKAKRGGGGANTYMYNAN